MITGTIYGIFGHLLNDQQALFYDGNTLSEAMFASNCAEYHTSWSASIVANDKEFDFIQSAASKYCSAYQASDEGIKKD